MPATDDTTGLEDLVDAIPTSETAGTAGAVADDLAVGKPGKFSVKADGRVLHRNEQVPDGAKVELVDVTDYEYPA